MKITDNRKEEEKEVAEAGDLIKVYGTVCLVVTDIKTGKKKLVIWDKQDENSCYIAERDCMDAFRKKDYTIYAKKGTWGMLIE
jgi:hypothetical protein